MYNGSCPQKSIIKEFGVNFCHVLVQGNVSKFVIHGNSTYTTDAADRKQVGTA